METSKEITVNKFINKANEALKKADIKYEL